MDILSIFKESDDYLFLSFALPRPAVSILLGIECMWSQVP